MVGRDPCLWRLLGQPFLQGVERGDSRIMLTARDFYLLLGLDIFSFRTSVFMGWKRKLGVPGFSCLALDG